MLNMSFYIVKVQYKGEHNIFCDNLLVTAENIVEVSQKLEDIYFNILSVELTYIDKIDDFLLLTEDAADEILKYRGYGI